MPTVTHTYGCTYGTADPINESAQSGGENVNVIVVDRTVIASQTNLLHELGFDTDDLQSVFLITDGGMTVKTNSSSEPDDTFTFAAGIPLVWQDGSPLPNPFSADVNALYLTTGSGGSVRIRGKIVAAASGS